MATTLYGFTWVGDDEPSVGVLAGQHWYQPTAGTESIRDSTNSVWNYLISSDQTNGGLVAQSGSSVTGPILNIPNYLPTTNPNAIGDMTVNGFPVALQADLATMAQQMNANMANLVRSQFLSNFSQTAVAENIAFYSEVVTTTVANIGVGYFSGQTDYGSGAPTLAQAQAIATTQSRTFQGIPIPLPVFSSDGLTATTNQLKGYGWSMVQWPIHVGSTGGEYQYYIQELSDTPRLLCGYWSNGDTPSGTDAVRILIWALATR